MLSLMVQLVSMGEELRQYTPPPDPCDAVLSVMVQLVSVAETTDPIETPPPFPAFPPVDHESVEGDVFDVKYCDCTPVTTRGVENGRVRLPVSLVAKWFHAGKAAKDC